MQSQCEMVEAERGSLDEFTNNLLCQDKLTRHKCLYLQATSHLLSNQPYFITQETVAGMGYASADEYLEDYLTAIKQIYRRDNIAVITNSEEEFSEWRQHVVVSLVPGVEGHKCFDSRSVLLNSS